MPDEILQIRSLLGGSASRTSARAASPAHRRAISAARARSIGEYIHLSCGHISTAETSERYRHWAPHGCPHFCELCDEFVPRQRRAARRRVPDEPAF